MRRSGEPNLLRRRRPTGSGLNTRWRAALSPPGFSAIEIDGEHYWDAGLVSSTPLRWVLDSNPRQDTPAFQVDLWCARGEIPGNPGRCRDEGEGKSNIPVAPAPVQISSNNAQCIRNNAVPSSPDGLPKEMRGDPDVELLKTIADRNLYNIVHLTYRSRQLCRIFKGLRVFSIGDGGSLAGRIPGHGAHPSPSRSPWSAPTNREGVLTFDLARDGRE